MATAGAVVTENLLYPGASVFRNAFEYVRLLD
jgi:hypothetical protein